MSGWGSWLGFGGGNGGDGSSNSTPTGGDTAPDLSGFASSDFTMKDDAPLFGGSSSSGSLYGGGGGIDGGGDSSATSSPIFTPPLALEQIKHAGVPLNRQMTPYLQMDPSIFQAQPQYIMPEGNEHGKGKFEFALSHIGWAVGGGFFLGCARGALPELVNHETRQLRGKPWLTRMANATVKHGSGFAQPFGAIVFLYSVFEIGLKSVRAEDDLNSLAAGALAGALYRSPNGLRASAKASGVGFLLATAWAIVNQDSRQRFREMFNIA